MKRFNPSIVQDLISRSFWLLPAVAMLAGAGLGFVVPLLDDTSNGALGIFTTSDVGSARGILETIATVTVSVAGIAFSVTVVALQLASQQLSPRVLRTFQADRLNRATLAVFLGVFVYALTALGRLGSATEAPNLVITVGVTGAIIAFALFAAFIHNVVVSLQAETVIARIGGDARALIERPFPERIGDPAERQDEAHDLIRRRIRAGSEQVSAWRPGFFNAIEGGKLLRAACENDGVVVQRLALGGFVLPGTVLAEVAADGDIAELAQRVRDSVSIGHERTLVQDVAFPIRQLADIGLRGLSAGINDPTTTETALGELAGLLIMVAEEPRPPAARVADDGEPRFLAVVPALDDLVRLGFEQISQASNGHPVVIARLIELLQAVERRAQDGEGEEIGRRLDYLRSLPC